MLHQILNFLMLIHRVEERQFHAVPAAGPRRQSLARTDGFPHSPESDCGPLRSASGVLVLGAGLCPDLSEHVGHFAFPGLGRAPGPLPILPCSM